VPLGLLAKTFVTVVTLLASSRVLVDADLATSVCPAPRAGSVPAGDRATLVIVGRPCRFRRGARR